MAYAPHGVMLLGSFVEKDHGKTFEYTDNPCKEMVFHVPIHGEKLEQFPHLIFVGPLQETRVALVKKTVAYVVTDEFVSNGTTFYTVEKWDIKNHRKYSK